MYGPLLPRVHIPACCLRIQTCLGDYCNRQHTAFVLLEAQRPSLLCIAGNIPWGIVRHIRAPLQCAALQETRLYLS
jgi:hypothetical protein